MEQPSELELASRSEGPRNPLRVAGIVGLLAVGLRIRH